MNTIINTFYADQSSTEIGKLPWWVILLIIVFILLLLLIIPWGKISKKKEIKHEVLNKALDEKTKNKENEPYMGVYNWFGKKQSLRLSKIVYVREEEDPCDLCRPWENTVIIIADEHSQAPTMKEAIAAGYHHVGCKHIDLDYFEGVTKIPSKKFSEEHKIKRYQLRLEQYKFEQTLRDLNYEVNNSSKDEVVKKSQKQLKIINEKYQKFLDDNSLTRNIERENPLVDDFKRFK